jgi:uncharacterized membrane protein YwzB
VWCGLVGVGGAYVVRNGFSRNFFCFNIIIIILFWALQSSPLTKIIRTQNPLSGVEEIMYCQIKWGYGFSGFISVQFSPLG